MGRSLQKLREKLGEKLREALLAVLPISAVVIILCFTIAPVTPGVLLCFLLGAVLVIAGMMFFTLGADMSMTPMGEKVGGAVTRSGKLWKVVLIFFILGFIITVSEPDLTVLANQVPQVPNMVIICAVAAGVGIFLVLAILRMLLGIALPPVLTFFYVICFILAFFTPREFLSVAFDSGGVTTGPMTVPFIMALGVGIASIRSDRHAADDSFGLIAMCSVGPILAVLLLGIFYNPTGAGYEPSSVPAPNDSAELWAMFASEIPQYMQEIALSLLPIVLFFGLYQVVSLHMSRQSLGRVAVGLVYTYIGLVLFLTGANVGFLPAGNYLGSVLASGEYRWALIPAAMVMGFLIVRAEPAVYVLNKRVEEMTDGAISSGAMGLALGFAVALSLALAMVRVLTGISVLWFLIPGYAIALGISFFVPKIYTAIAFDAGGVASGPMATAFLLPLAQGACLATGGDVVADAFGVVAMVAMTPPITVQVMGLISGVRRRKAAAPVPVQAGLDAVIEL
ncbi:MAG TPA: DUF1538 domain-containing protein [Candidatus Faecivivens stercoravium]|uniref:DUF1538 domain-containing protein n=1 Tax=Candidatus Faecivivens stercoravium TaxID=2840803 RepID=A0A9D1DYJ8_9FIRM|nr:DUF1538 domain-containing protein [Candidatus Faecivivens stercoravium]